MPSLQPQTPDSTLNKMLKSTLDEPLKDTIPFFILPHELHLKLFEYLNPIDSTCLSLTNKYIYNLKPPTPRLPLNTGAPDSCYPVITTKSCKYCCPVLYYPAHCQLHYHLRPSIPPHMTYCSGPCAKYTARAACTSADVCSDCGIKYRRCYERGRRMLDMQRPGEKQARLRKWYNHNPKYI